jgi:hypothetical protein
VFGGASPDREPVRVEVQVRACLSFADLLGLLSFTPGVCLLWEELSDDDLIRETLQYALLHTELDTMDANAQKATAAYHGALRGPLVDIAFMRALGTAVTRVFGVSA